MQKKWLILKNEIVEVKECGYCFIMDYEWNSVREEGFCECSATNTQCKDTGTINDDCSLIEAETREEAMQKMFDVFRKDHNEDDWNRFIDDFKNLIIVLGGSPEEAFDADKK